MTDHNPSEEDIGRLRKLSGDATKGEWFTESENVDTSHGNVMTLSIFADGEKSWQDVPLFQATAEAMVVDCDDDYDAPRLFDRTSFANAEFAVACVNYVRELLRISPAMKVTEAMIEAGLRARDEGNYGSDAELLRAVYLEMHSAKEG